MKVLSALTTEAPCGAVVGETSHDDAAILRWPDGSVDGPYLVSTVDIITPVVDDPRTYGAIAAANAISDVYAMGGSPRFALAIAAFPSDRLPLWVLQEILAGGAAKAREAGAFVVGGHTLEDSEPKYGLAVTGEVRREHLVTMAGAQPGDALVLTKALGTGLLVGALRKDALDADEERALVASMLELNETSAVAMVALGAHAATDVTGFGLLGHALRMAQASKVSLALEARALPALPGALDRAAAASLGGAAGRNFAYVQQHLERDASDATLRLAVDAQTSGGLLIALPEAPADALVRRLLDDGVRATRIGTVLPRDPGPPLRLTA